jgi:transposase
VRTGTCRRTAEENPARRRRPPAAAIFTSLLHVRAFRAEKQEHWFAGLESAFTTFGGVPEEVLMDKPLTQFNSGRCLQQNQ